MHQAVIFLLQTALNTDFHYLGKADFPTRFMLIYVTSIFENLRFLTPNDLEWTRFDKGDLVWP